MNSHVQVNLSSFANSNPDNLDSEQRHFAQSLAGQNRHMIGNDGSRNSMSKLPLASPIQKLLNSNHFMIGILSHNSMEVAFTVQSQEKVK